MILLGIAIGGALGSILRYLVQVQCIEWFGTKFPYGNLAINAAGSLLIGFFSIIFLQRLLVATEVRFAIIAGLLGGFTTFSAFSLETISLMQQGSLASAASNILFSIVLCIAACFLGMTFARIV